MASNAEALRGPRGFVRLETPKSFDFVDLSLYYESLRSISFNLLRVPPAFWSYQSGSYEKRPNWILPLHTSFQQEMDVVYQLPVCFSWGGRT